MSAAIAIIGCAILFVWQWRRMDKIELDNASIKSDLFFIANKVYNLTQEQSHSELTERVMRAYGKAKERE